MKATTVGIQKTFQYCFLALGIIALVPLSVVGYHFFAHNRPISIGIPNFTLPVWINIATSTTLLTLYIRWIGAIAGRMIRVKKYPPFWVSLLALWSIWLALFIIGSLVTSMVEGILHGSRYFWSTLTSDLVRGSVFTIPLGFLHGLTMGWFMGRAIYNPR